MTQNTITSNALVSRINRKLHHQGRKLRKSRGHRTPDGRVLYDSNLGEYYVIDVDRNLLVEGHVDPEELGRDLGVLSSGEILGSDA